MTQGSSIGRSIRRIDGGEKVTGLTRFAGDLAAVPHAARPPGPEPARPCADRQDRRERGRGPARASSESSPPPISVSRRPTRPRGASRRSRSTARCSWGIRSWPSWRRRRRSPRMRPRSSRSSTSLLPASVDVLDAMRPDAPRVRAAAGAGGEAELAMHGAATGGEQAPRGRSGPNVVSTQHFTRGDLARGFADADVVVERRYDDADGPPGLPRAARGGGRRRSARRRSPSGPRPRRSSSRGRRCAEALGLSEHEVQIVATPMGGGFGAKFVLLEPPGGRARAPAAAAGLGRHDADARSSWRRRRRRPPCSR